MQKNLLAVPKNDACEILVSREKHSLNLRFNVISIMLLIIIIIIIMFINNINVISADWDSRAGGACGPITGAARNTRIK